MPDRIIRESSRESRTLHRLSDGAERTFWRLTVTADDHGRFDADPRVLLSRCYPLRVETWRPSRLAAHRQELHAAGLIQLYEVDERVYGRFLKWEKHQRQRDSKPKYPGPEEGTILAVPPPFAADGGESPQLAADRGELRQVAANGGGGDSRRMAATRRSRARPRAAGHVRPASESREPRGESRGAGGGSRAQGGQAPSSVPLPPWVADLPFPSPPQPWWQATMALFPGLDHEAVARDAAAYWLAHPGKYRDVKQYLARQFRRAWERRRAETTAGDRLPRYLADHDFTPDGDVTPEARAREAARLAALGGPA